jgi:hypothetical protein
MSKFLLVLFIVTFSQFLVANDKNPNLLIIDSSFAPTKIDQFDLGTGTCFVISESAELDVDKGDCYGREDWQLFKNYDSTILKGMMNSLAGIDGLENAKWKDLNATKPDEAKKIRNTYILSVHGSRASYIAYKYSENKADPLPLRVITASAGATKQKQNVNVKNATNSKEYSSDCHLRNWSKEEANDFHSKEKLQEYQEKISEILAKNPAIKVISISLGYKKSWIQEDNAKCSASAIDREYQILTDTWNNLFHKFKDRLFVVAAGNESVNFDNAADKNDDLWAYLSENNNLLLVGSLKKNGERFPSSNYGKKVLMTKGEEIETISPIPDLLEGYKTTVRGTSFSAPIITGLAVKVIHKNPKISINELRATLEKLAPQIK